MEFPRSIIVPLAFTLAALSPSKAIADEESSVHLEIVAALDMVPDEKGLQVEGGGVEAAVTKSLGRENRTHIEVGGMAGVGYAAAEVSGADRSDFVVVKPDPIPTLEAKIGPVVGLAIPLADEFSFVTHGFACVGFTYNDRTFIGQDAEGEGYYVAPSNQGIFVLGATGGFELGPVTVGVGVEHIPQRFEIGPRSQAPVAETLLTLEAGFVIPL